MAEKTGFILHYEVLENIELLGNDVAMEVLKALSKYDRGEKVEQLSAQAQFSFNAYSPLKKMAQRKR